MIFSFINLVKKKNIAILFINDPPANTLTYDLVLELERVFLGLLIDKDIEAVIITGTGDKFFSGGVNIGMLRSASQYFNSNFILYAAEVFDWIQNSPLLVVAGINGHITGGGLELALIADKRIAVKGDYNFGFPEIKLGVIPGLGGTQRLQKIVGYQEAMEMITNGQFIDINRANEIGAVDGLVTNEPCVDGFVDFTETVMAESSYKYNRFETVCKDSAFLEIDGQSGYVEYKNENHVGVITIKESCGRLPVVEALWHLNNAILVARADEDLGAIYIHSENSNTRLGDDSKIDDLAKDYAQLVFRRLENFPRLCVIKVSNGAGAMDMELALNCDYRFIDTVKDTQFTVFETQKLERYSGHFDVVSTAAGKAVITLKDPETNIFIKYIKDKNIDLHITSWLHNFIPPKGASKAIGYAKLAIVKGHEMSMESGMLLERHLQEQLFRSYDSEEGMKAYMEKRATSFKGE